MKLHYLPLFAALSFAALTLRAEDPATPGKSSTTTTSPNAAKEHSDTAPVKPSTDKNQSPAKPDVAGTKKAAGSGDSAVSSANKEVTPPVAGSNGSIGGTKAAK